MANPARPSFHRREVGCAAFLCSPGPMIAICLFVMNRSSGAIDYGRNRPWRSTFTKTGKLPTSIWSRRKRWSSSRIGTTPPTPIRKFCKNSMTGSFPRALDASKAVIQYGNIKDTVRQAAWLHGRKKAWTHVLCRALKSRGRHDVIMAASAATIGESLSHVFDAVLHYRCGEEGRDSPDRIGHGIGRFWNRPPGWEINCCTGIPTSLPSGRSFCMRPLCHLTSRGMTRRRRRLANR